MLTHFAAFQTTSADKNSFLANTIPRARTRHCAVLKRAAPERTSGAALLCPALRRNRFRLRCGEVNCFGEQNGLDATQGVEHLVADLTIDLHHRYCRCFLPPLPAAEREVGDVDILLPKHRSDAAHNAGHVEITQVDEGQTCADRKSTRLNSS